MKTMLDSGAFSAWTRQKEINLDEYIQFCLEHMADLDYIVNLDVIPGRFGQKNLPKEEIERSASTGWANWKRMRAAGIPGEKIIHIFHQGEDWKWLKRMLAHKDEMPYIGISPANDRTTAERATWLDECMKYLCLNGDGKPIVKFHGFAVTSPRLMFRYPWTSVDSSSWRMIAGYGDIVLPKRGKRGYEVINMSTKKNKPGRNWAQLPPMEKAQILKWAEEINGATEEDLINTHYHRSAFNGYMFWKMGQAQNCNIFLAGGVPVWTLKRSRPIHEKMLRHHCHGVLASYWFKEQANQLAAMGREFHETK